MDISSDRSKAYLRTALFIALGVLLVIIVFFFVALRSLPGGMLYAFKVNVIEEAFEVIAGGAKDKAEYHLSLLERRYDEAQSLSKVQDISEGDLNYFTAETNERFLELTALLAAETDLGITLRDALDISNKATAILLATEESAKSHEHLVVLEESIEDIAREAKNLYDDRVDQFTVHASEEEVREYIAFMLGNVLQRVENGNLNRDLRDDVGRLLERAQRNIVAGKGATAIIRIAEADRAIAVADRLGTISIDPEPVVRQNSIASSTDATTTPESEEVPVNTATSTATSS